MSIWERFSHDSSGISSRPRVNQTRTSAHQTEACSSIIGLKEAEDIQPELWPQTHRQPRNPRPSQAVGTDCFNYLNPHVLKSPWYRVHPCTRKGFGKQHVAPEHCGPTLSYTILFEPRCLRSSIPNSLRLSLDQTSVHKHRFVWLGHPLKCILKSIHQDLYITYIFTYITSSVHSRFYGQRELQGFNSWFKWRTRKNTDFVMFGCVSSCNKICLFVCCYFVWR